MTSTQGATTERALSAKQRKAVEALLVGASDQQAAEAAGVNRNTIANWKRDHAGFTEALALARTDLLKRMTARLHAATSLAVKALEDVAKDARNPSARVSAARSIIEFSQRAIELEELERRITELEAALAENKPEA